MKKILTWGVPLIAMLCLGFGAASSMMLTPQEQLSTPANPPAVTSLGSGTVAGLGTVEPLNERVALSPQVTGVVAKVKIVAGQKVKQGDLLFSLDDRELRADLAVQQRQQELMEAKLKKLRAGTRPEDLPPARAKVESARAARDRAKDHLARIESIRAQGVITKEELQSRRYDAAANEALLAQAEAELKRLEAGTWAFDIAVADQELAVSKANVERVKTNIERLSVHSPADGVVLRCNVREGEYAHTQATSTPLVVLGREGPVQLRVQVDEQDAGRVVPGAVAEAYTRDRLRRKIELKFIRIEPNLVPKTNLTSSTMERVDTRVLIVVYEIPEKPDRVYFGQQLDVFIRPAVE